MSGNGGAFFMLCGFGAFAASAYLYNQADFKVAQPSIAAGVVDAGHLAPSDSRDRYSTSDDYPSAVIKRHWDGHFWADADINGETIEFMVDTGATLVALTEADAQRIGIYTPGLTYNWTVTTAGGEVNGAPINIELMSIGGVEVRDVQAIVLREGLSKSLLGNSFTRYMHSMEFRGDRLIMRQ